MSSRLKKLPIGIQTFRDMREQGYYYVDKSGYACQLSEQGKYFFLSRPRRFGKSLFLDTLKELFEGNKALFLGLEAEHRWDWSHSYPIIKISFGAGVIRNRAELDVIIHEHLNNNAHRLGVTLQSQSISGRFSELISSTAQKYSTNAVVLIDEYDKPILDNLSHPEQAIETREGLKNLYTVIKDADPYLRFVLLTGVSKFSKVSLFSGLNNLNDITLDPRYSALCGYTDQDLDTVFSAELTGLDREQIRNWYNGYNWGGESVYNPFDLLLLFDQRLFKPFWFESATPTFLVNLLNERSFFTPDLAQLQSGEALLSRFDVGDISNEALLFQAGYLTLHGVEELTPGRRIYQLGYPNLEVQVSLNEALLPGLGVPASSALLNGSKLLKALKIADLLSIEHHLKALFDSIPHDWHRKNNIANYEGYYASVFYSHFAALGLPVSVEDSSRTGRVDMSLSFAGHRWLFEFKVVENKPSGAAIEQLKTRGYSDKYRNEGMTIHQVGIEFSREQRQIVAFDAI